MGILRILFRLSTWSSNSTGRRTYHPTNRPLKSVDRRVEPLPPPSFPRAGELADRCYVIDGDTIVIERTRIRLAGIDAPELDQPWGRKAKWALIELCRGKVVTARLNGERSYDRLVATCYLPDGRDIGAELIKQGLALDWHYFSGGRYRHLEPEGVRRKLWQVHIRQEVDSHHVSAHPAPHLTP